MKKEESPILNELGKEPGFKVPQDYFADFNRRMAESLPDVEITPVDAPPTMWQRVRPYVYLAAMFAGVWCLMQVFTMFTGKTNTSITINEIAESMSNDSQNADDFIMSGNVSDYDILNYEDSVAMSNQTSDVEPATDDNNQQQ